MNTIVRVSDAVEYLKGLFLEVPGTQLSVAEAARLSGLDQTSCRVILNVLEEARFLTRTGNDVFIRRTSDSPFK